MDDYDPACPTEDESQLMDLDLSQVPLPPTLPTQSKTRSRNYSKQKSPISDKEDDKKGKKKKRKKKRHGRDQDEEEKEQEVAPNITEVINEPEDLPHKDENATEREEKTPSSETSSSQLPGDQVKANTPSAPLSSDAMTHAASISSRSSGRLQFKLAPDPASGKSKVLFQLNKPLKVSALRVASDEEEGLEAVVEEEEKQIIEKTAAGEYVPTRFKVSKKHEMYKPNLLGPGLTVVFNPPSAGTALGSVQPISANSGGSNQPAMVAKEVDGNSRGDLRKISDEVRKKKEDDDAQALPLRRSERRRSRDTKEQEKEGEGGSRSGRLDRSLDRRGDSRGTRSSSSRSQKDEGRRRESGGTGRRGKAESVQERRRSSRFQKDEEERKDKDAEAGGGGRRHQHRHQDSSAGDRRTRNARKSRSGSRDRKIKSPSQSPPRSKAMIEEGGEAKLEEGGEAKLEEGGQAKIEEGGEAKMEEVGQADDKSESAVGQLGRCQEPSPPRDQEIPNPEKNPKQVVEVKSALALEPCSPAVQNSHLLNPLSGVQADCEEASSVEAECVLEKPVKEDVTEKKGNGTLRLESSDSEGAAKKTVQKLVIRRSFDTNDFQVTRNDLAEGSTEVKTANSGSVKKTPVKDPPSSPKKRMKSTQGRSPGEVNLSADADDERETRNAKSGASAGRPRKEKKDERGISTSRRESLRRQGSNSTESDEERKEKVNPRSKKSPVRHEMARGRPSSFRVDEPALSPEQVFVDVSAIPGKSKWEMEDDEEEETEPAVDVYKNNIYGNYKAEQQKLVAKALEPREGSWRRSARLQMDAAKKSTQVRPKARESSSNDDDLSQDRHRGKEKKRRGHKSKAEKKNEEEEEETWRQQQCRGASGGGRKTEIKERL